jgi:hypothetical protein
MYYNSKRKNPPFIYFRKLLNPVDFCDGYSYQSADRFKKIEKNDDRYRGRAGTVSKDPVPVGCSIMFFYRCHLNLSH